MNLKRELLMLFCIAGYLVVNAQVIAIGDKGFRLDTNCFNPRTTAVNEWVKAGVEGGIPPAASLKVVAKAKPGDNLQLLIDKAARKGGVVLLQKGEYIIDKTLNMRSGVVLRGESAASVKLNVIMKGDFKRGMGARTAAIKLNGIQRSGLEQLTIQYKAVDFEPNDRNSFDAPWEVEVFHRREMRDSSLFVEQVWIDQSRNCWVQDCRILWAGNDPIRITLSDHITCRRNYIDRCYNKCDGGMGYYHMTNCRYVLVANDTVRRIRHFAIQNHSKYNVVINNYFEVDINFHNGDDGHNLIQGNTVRIPEWHSWNPVARGVPGQHLPPGKGNILVNNVFVNKGGQKVYSEPNVMYELSDNWEGAIAREIENK